MLDRTVAEWGRPGEMSSFPAGFPVFKWRLLPFNKIYGGIEVEP